MQDSPTDRRSRWPAWKWMAGGRHDLPAAAHHPSRPAAVPTHYTFQPPHVWRQPFAVHGWIQVCCADCLFLFHKLVLWFFLFYIVISFLLKSLHRFKSEFFGIHFFSCTDRIPCVTCIMRNIADIYTYFLLIIVSWCSQAILILASMELLCDVVSMFQQQSLQPCNVSLTPHVIVSVTEWAPTRPHRHRPTWRDSRGSRDKALAS